MATNLKLDDDVLAEAVKLGGFRTKRETVMQALVEFIERRKRLGILTHTGSIDFDPDYDYKAERRRT